MIRDDEIQEEEAEWLELPQHNNNLSDLHVSIGRIGSDNNSVYWLMDQVGIFMYR